MPSHVCPHHGADGVAPLPICPAHVHEEPGGLTEAIQLGPTDDVNSFLGCEHHVGKYPNKGGKVIRTQI